MLSGHEQRAPWRTTERAPGDASRQHAFSAV